MAIVKTVTRAEEFIMQMNGDYNICFDTVLVTIAAAVPAGTLLKDAATTALDADTAVLGILAEDKPAGSHRVRVMTRGNPTLIDGAKVFLSAGVAVGQASPAGLALQAKGLIFAK